VKRPDGLIDGFLRRASCTGFNDLGKKASLLIVQLNSHGNIPFLHQRKGCSASRLYDEQLPGRCGQQSGNINPELEQITFV
jgi:hypothetical protein